jgi:hypothetical protein
MTGIPRAHRPPMTGIPRAHRPAMTGIPRAAAVVTDGPRVLLIKRFLRSEICR